MSESYLGISFVGGGKVSFKGSKADLTYKSIVEAYKNGNNWATCTDAKGYELTLVLNNLCGISYRKGD